MNDRYLMVSEFKYMLNLVFKRCNKEDVENILALQEKVFADLGKRTDLLRRNTREMFELCVEGPNITIGIFDTDHEDRLIGVGISVDAAGTEEDLSCHLVKYSTHGNRSCNMKLVMVSKEYYGHGLQLKVMQILERCMQAEGYQYICATVSPDNLFSRRNCEAFGFKADHEELKYGGLKRLVYFKEIEAIPNPSLDSAGKELYVEHGSSDT